MTGKNSLGIYLEIVFARMVVLTMHLDHPCRKATPYFESESVLSRTDLHVESLQNWSLQAKLEQTLNTMMEYKVPPSAVTYGTVVKVTWKGKSTRGLKEVEMAIQRKIMLSPAETA